MHNLGDDITEFGPARSLRRAELPKDFKAHSTTFLYNANTK
jgi:hypothetical protein